MESLIQKPILELRNIGRNLGFTNTRNYGKHNKKVFVERILDAQRDDDERNKTQHNETQRSDSKTQRSEHIETQPLELKEELRQKIVMYDEVIHKLTKDITTLQTSMHKLKKNNEIQTASIQKLNQELKAHQKQSLKERLKLEDGVCDNLQALEYNKRKKKPENPWW